MNEKDPPTSPRAACLGDLLADKTTFGEARTQAAQPSDAPFNFDETIRNLALAMNEDPDELLHLARGTTPLARLVRLLLDEQKPPPRISPDEKLYWLDQRVKREGLKGKKRSAEVLSRYGKKMSEGALKAAIGRYRRHLGKLLSVGTVAGIFESSISKPLKPRGRPRKKEKGAEF